MKKTIITTMICSLFVLLGCSDPVVCQACDYTPYTTQATYLMSTNSQLMSEKAVCTTDLATSKAQANQLKLNCLNQQQYIKQDTSTACVSFINQIVRLDERLEECYMNSSNWNSSNSTQLTKCLTDLDTVNDTLEDIKDLMD